jgi:hypothetical protein
LDNFSSVISIFIKLSITFYERYTILMVLITVKTFPDFQWAYLKPCRGWNFLSHLTSPWLFVDDFLLARQIQVLAIAWKKLPCSPWKITFGLLIFCLFFCYSCFVITVRPLQFPFVTCWLEKWCQTLLTHDQSTFNIFGCNCFYLTEV